LDSDILNQPKGMGRGIRSLIQKQPRSLGI